MDNLSSHKSRGVRDAVEAAGASLLYLPPYSPDFYPIEQALDAAQSLRPGLTDHLVELTRNPCSTPSGFRLMAGSSPAITGAAAGALIVGSAKPVGD